jgi:hypothetical protein
MRLGSRLLQFRTIEVTALEKRQRNFENESLARFEFKLSATLWRRANRCALLFAERELILRSDDDPDSALRAGDARTRNAIGHTKIIRPSRRSPAAPGRPVARSLTQ